MARASMADLIARLRLVIDDPAGANEVFGDDKLQDALDARRINCRQLELTPGETWSPTAVTYLDYYARYGDWEDDAVLQDGQGNTLTPDTDDLVTGHWTFASDQDPPVYLTGKTYDLQGTAADLFEAWAAKVVLQFDATADGATMRRSQKREGLLLLAAQARKRARPFMGTLARSDVQG